MLPSARASPHSRCPLAPPQNPMMLYLKQMAIGKEKSTLLVPPLSKGPSAAAVKILATALLPSSSGDPPPPPHGHRVSLKCLLLLPKLPYVNYGEALSRGHWPLVQTL